MENATLIVMLALLQYVFFGLKAGLARQKHQVKAPATAGHEMFERAYRVQLNTLEAPAIIRFGQLGDQDWDYEHGQKSCHQRPQEILDHLNFPSTSLEFISQ